MQKTHNAMVQDGAVVKVPQETIENVAEAYPDLRGVKKKERTPILKESMSNLKENIRQFLNGFKNQKFEFDVKGKILEARLYSTGINEVLEKITQEKANMLYSTEDIFKNSRYMYSTTDYDGNPNIYRWNYFYTPVQIGDDVVGVRIAIRDIAEGQEHGPESQIYNWNIKKDISLDGAQPVKNDSSRDVSSDISIYNISKTQEKVNNDYISKEASSQEENASFFDGNFKKSTPKINPDEVISGIWEDSPNKSKNIVEKSQLEKFDNNNEDWYNKNDIITDGSHLVNGKLKPNVKYKSGEYDYIYATDQLGRIVDLHTDELQYTERDERLKHNANSPGKEIGDHAGHLIGDRYGGSPDIDNIVSQSGLVNLSEYKKIENIWARALDSGQKVGVDIKVQYEGNSMRPSSFIVNCTIDGIKTQITIEN